MKQTAVEWFYNELKNLIKESELTEMKPSEFDKRELELIRQAKAMEKGQIEDAFYTEQIDEFGDEVTFEDYYNETFKSE